MIFTVESKAFTDAMSIAGRVIPAKSAWPIMLNLKIVTNDDRVTLIGSDTDTTFEADVGANVETEGVALVPYAPLAAFIKAAKSTTVRFELDDDKVKVIAGRSRISLAAGDVDVYPNQRPAEGDTATLDAPAFCKALRFALAAADDDDTRHHIAGPNLATVDGSLVIWGTDGKSAHRATIADVPDIGGGATLPVAAAQVILSAAEKHETVKLMVSERGWHLTTADVRVWGKVIDAAFPDMARVVGQFSGWRDVIHAHRDDIATAISVATCGTEADSAKSRNLVLRTGDGEPVVIRGQKTIGGVIHAGRAEMDVTGKADFAASVSAKYFSGAITGMGANDIIIEGCTDDGSPYAKAVRAKPAQSDATIDMMALVMALRVSEGELADV